MGARKNDLDVFGSFSNLEQVGLNTIATPVGLPRNLLGGRQDSFGLAQIDEIIPSFLPHDDPVDEIALPRGIFLQDGFPFGFSDLLANHLLRRLGRNPSQFIHLDEGSDLIADLRPGIDTAGFGKRDLGFRINDRFDDGAERDDGDLSGLVSI